MLKIDQSPKHEVILKEENDIYQFSESVIKELSQNNIPSIPSNYSIYFEKLLYERTSEFKEKLGSALEFYNQPSTKVNENNIYIEKEIKQGFVQIKSMLQAVALIYKNLSLMKGIITKHQSMLSSNTDILAVQNVVSAFNEDLVKLVVLMDKHVDVIKSNYEEIGKMFKVIEEQAVYDSNFDVYNKKFLINTMQTELESTKRYDYSSSFLLIKLDDKIMFKMSNLKDKNRVLKDIAQTLLKISRSSDVVAHYDDGCFAIVMKHTDIIGAEQACARMRRLTKHIKYDQNRDDAYIEICMVAGSLGITTSSVEETLSKALDALSVATSKEPVILE